MGVNDHAPQQFHQKLSLEARVGSMTIGDLETMELCWCTACAIRTAGYGVYL